MTKDVNNWTAIQPANGTKESTSANVKLRISQEEGMSASRRRLVSFLDLFRHSIGCTNGWRCCEYG